MKYLLRSRTESWIRNGCQDQKRSQVPHTGNRRQKQKCAVAETFEEILGGTNVGADDSFFELGGDFPSKR